MLKADKPWDLGIIREGIALMQNLLWVLYYLYLYAHDTPGVLRYILAPAAP